MKYGQQQGGILLEVLIALAILALAMTAIIAQYGRQIAYFEQSRDRVLAHWAAHNELTMLQLQGQWLSLGEQAKTVTLADRQWHLQQVVTATPNKTIWRVRFFLRSEQQDALGTFVGYMGKP